MLMWILMLMMMMTLCWRCDVLLLLTSTAMSSYNGQDWFDWEHAKDDRIWNRECEKEAPNVGNPQGLVDNRLTILDNFLTIVNMYNLIVLTIGIFKRNIFKKIQVIKTKYVLSLKINDCQHDSVININDCQEIVKDCQPIVSNIVRIANIRRASLALPLSNSSICCFSKRKWAPHRPYGNPNEKF